MSSEALSYKVSFGTSYSTLYPLTRPVESLNTGLGAPYQMTTDLRTLTTHKIVYYQINSLFAGRMYEDANQNDAIIDFTVDFWVHLSIGKTTLVEKEQEWSGRFLLPAGYGLFYKAVDPLMDPWWWQDPALGNPAGVIQNVLAAPEMSVEPERIDNSDIYHAQIHTVLQHIEI